MSVTNDASAAQTSQGSQPAWAHTPLANPAGQIRLLQLLPGSDSDVIRLQSHHVTLAEAPTFNAISYTWGSPDIQKELFIDGRGFTVWSNCCDALCQVREQRPESFVWIDSICINQEDCAEKSVQVSIMWDIYRKASWVLACLGPHEDDSEFLFRKINSVIEWSPGFVTWDWVRTVWLPTLEKEEALRIWIAFFFFSRRPYWRRLWIIQELAAHNEGDKSPIGLLCGAESLTWSMAALMMCLCKEIRSRADEYNLPPNPDGHVLQVEATPLHVLQQAARRGYTDLVNTILSFGRFKCFDPRDRIYGVLGFVYWESGTNPIMPDYSINTFELALRTCPLVAFCNTPAVLAALLVDHDHADMLSLVERRSDHNGARRLSDTLPHSQTFTVVLDYFGHIYQDKAFAPLVPLHARSESAFNAVLPRDDDQQMGTSEDSVLYQHFSSLLHDPENELATAFQGRQPKLVVSNGSLGAIVSSTARDGDFIVPTGCFTHDAFLVLRQHRHPSLTEDIDQLSEEDLLRKAIEMSMEKEISSEDQEASPAEAVDDRLQRFDIVGQGFLVNGHKFPNLRDSARLRYTMNDGKSFHEVLRGRVEAQLTAEDMVLLTGQDASGEKGTGCSKSYSPRARLQRLLTRPVEYPVGAATVRVIEIEEMEALRAKDRPPGMTMGMVDI